MNPDSIDRILTTEEELIPSSGFLASVMERVQEEAAAPPPIPFPWKRAIPGILLTVAVLGGGAYLLVRSLLPAARGLLLSPPPLSAALVQSLQDAAWVAGALAAAQVCWLFSRRLAGRSGLL